MPFKNKQSLREYAKRRSERGSRLGRNLEDDVANLLDRMKSDGLIDDFIKHLANSPEDMGGKDFTVIKLAGQEKTERSFGITISMRCWHNAKLKHSDIPQFCFPIGTKPETIKNRVLELFENT